MRNCESSRIRRADISHLRWVLPARFFCSQNKFLLKSIQLDCKKCPLIVERKNSLFLQKWNIFTFFAAYLLGEIKIFLKKFFKKVNPRRISEPATMPRLRCFRDCVTQFNKDYPNRKIDKATVSRYMKSKLVTRYFHGNTWFINYDELEKVLLKKVRINSKLKTK